MPSPIASLDFVNGVYLYSTTTLTAAQVVDLVSRISANGLSIVGGAPVQMLGQPRALLLTLNWSVVIEYQAGALPPNSGSLRAFLLTLADSLSFNSQVACYTASFPPTETECDSVFFEDNGAGTTRTAVSDDVDGNAIGTIPGINRCGYSRVDTLAAVCINGSAPVFLTSPVITPGSYGFPLTQAQLADATNASVTGFIRKIDIYAPLANSDLALLTSLNPPPPIITPPAPVSLVVTPTQQDINTALASFLSSILAVEIIAGQDNRVPEPVGPDFIVFWPIRRRRLATNVDTHNGFAQSEAYMQSTEITIQLDVHGPASSDNAEIITTMFRDGFAVDAFAALNPNVIPLHADDPRQVPFLNDQQQYETRWVVEALLQANQSVSAPLQSATIVDVVTVEVDTTYPP